MSGPLKNTRHERFCQERVKGKTQDEAYSLAGFSPDRGAASRLSANVNIIARIAELQAGAAERAEITAARVLEEMGKLAFSNMADFIRIGDDGDPYLDFTGMDRAQAAAVVEMTVDDFKDGRGEDAREVRRVKFKLADKKGPLVELGKHFGLFKDQVEHSGTVKVEDISADDARAKLVAFLSGERSRLSGAAINDGETQH